MKRIVGTAIVFAGLVSLLLAAPAVAGASGVDPASYSATLAAGSSATITKTVHTPAIPPNPDIVLLSDTTGSMGPTIANVAANADSIMSTVAADQPTAQFAAAEYKDGDPNFCASDPFAFRL
ncbi:MAG: hypothetical protein J2P17_17490, partial [Mycobacterium sp.]|nr:hypothetical protein [Mycobacterium sp.]